MLRRPCLPQPTGRRARVVPPAAWRRSSRQRSDHRRETTGRATAGRETAAVEPPARRRPWPRRPRSCRLRSFHRQSFRRRSRRPRRLQSRPRGRRCRSGMLPSGVRPAGVAVVPGSAGRRPLPRAKEQSQAKCKSVHEVSAPLDEELTVACLSTPYKLRFAANRTGSHFPTSGKSPTALRVQGRRHHRSRDSKPSRARHELPNAPRHTAYRERGWDKRCAPRPARRGRLPIGCTGRMAAERFSRGA